MSNHPASRLPRILALVYAVLVAYACLHPFSGWQASAGVLEFLNADWPRYYTSRDLILNTLGFMPLGFTVAAAMRTRLKAGWSLLGAVLSCTALSLAVEVLQNYLPGRVPSNLDLACNTLGGLLGAVAGLRWHGIFDRRGALHRWRVRRFLPGHAGEIGLILIGLWWLALLTPGSLLFATGDLRPLFDIQVPLGFSAQRHIALETSIAAANLLAIGLLSVRLMRSTGVAFLVGVPLVGLLVITLATVLFVAPQEPLRWASPGALRGLLLGSVLLVIALRLPGWLQHVLAGIALLCATALVNLSPENPFVTHISRVMLSGHALNFNGLTELVSRLWPFLALGWLTAVGSMPASARQ